AFAWRYLGAPEFRPRAASDAEPTDHPGVCWTGCSRAGGLQGTARISQVPGKPSGPFALLSDPGRTGYVLRDQGSTYPTRPPHQSTTRAPNGCKFRGSITRLLVSLSTPRGDGLPPLHARLASGCWSQLCRTGFDPQGFYERFLSISARPPFPSFHGASFVLALFYHCHLPPSAFTGHYPHAPRSTPHAGTSGVRPCADPPAGYCMQPTAELVRTGRDPISTSTPSISVCHRNRRFVQTKSIRFSPLAAAQPLTILSWPEALNASGSRRACWMAISRNASSLLALPDFPEFAPAVRYGVAGTPPSQNRFASLRASLSSSIPI